MTVSEAIRQADRLRPNTHDLEDKEMWLQTVENHVSRHMNLHEGYDMHPDVKADEQLLLDGADAEMYVLYLLCMYDYYNGEYDRYNNGALQYNQRLEDWRARFLREHMPKPFKGKRSLV